MPFEACLVDLGKMYVIDNARVRILLPQTERCLVALGNLTTENHYQNDCYNLIFNFLLLFHTTHLNFEVGKRGNNGQGHYWLYASFCNSL